MVFLFGSKVNYVCTTITEEKKNSQRFSASCFPENQQQTHEEK